LTAVHYFQATGFPQWFKEKIIIVREGLVNKCYSVCSTIDQGGD
jgi:hypothetical protein